MREGTWKLVSRFPDAWELYDMEQDRTERHDLADLHPDRVRKWPGDYAAWAKRVGVQALADAGNACGSERDGAMPSPDIC